MKAVQYILYHNMIQSNNVKNSGRMK